MTEEVSEVDRLLLISELEQAIQSFLTDNVIVEFDTRDDGNEKVLTITTTSAPTEAGITEEQTEEDTSDDNGDDNENGNGNGNDEPPEEPEEPEPPIDIPTVHLG
jgi:hypothetical protein